MKNYTKHKPIIKNFKKKYVQSPFINNLIL